MGTERTGYNNLTLEAYASFSTTRVLDTGDDLTRAQNIKFETMYPGGLFAVLTFTVMRDPSRSWPFKQGQRLVARNGLAIVWEGAIITPSYQDNGTSGARTITAIGYWGAGYLGATGQRKPWADMRITAAAWPELVASGYQLANVNRTNRLRIIPKDGQVWYTNMYFAVRYSAPTGVTIKRVKFDYDFSESANLTPAAVIDFNGVATYTDLAAAYDGTFGGGVTITITTAHFIYLGVNQSDADKITAGQTAVISITMGTTKNAVVSALSGAYWSDTTGNWAALTITDGTASGGKTLAQSGNVTFTKPGDMGKTPLGDTNKTSKIWMRFAVGTNLTASININEIIFGQTQNWELALYDDTLGNYTDTVTATGTGSIDRTFGTPTQLLRLALVSLAQQTAFGNGSIYAEFTNVRVYADANTITASEVVTDWNTFLTNTSSDTSQIASNTLAIEPWITGTNVDFETAASNLARVAALGDASFNPWAVYLLDSESAATPNGKPVLAYQQQPALTDYDYAVSLGAGTLQSLSLAQTQVYNDIIVSYTDANGVQQWVTSADDAGLTDATSTAAYGTFQYVLSLGQVSSTIAAGLGKRFLAQNKDVHFYVSGSIPVLGYILAKNGNPVPASAVRAGKRVKVLNFLTDEVGASGAGLTFIISHTAYDDDSETVMIDCGVPDNLAVMLARMAAGLA